MHVEVRNACASEEICACKSKCLAVGCGLWKFFLRLCGFWGKIPFLEVEKMETETSSND